MYQQNRSIAALDSNISELNASSINFLCWNIKKGLKPNWREDLSDLANGKDLVIIQEAILHPDLTEAFDESVHWSFTKGYKTKNAQRE
ncbi:MAG: hypothetical protein GKR92_07360 [Gammaproteobacteria bacterium]|nr:MAG: hypothetical protein GKR92_07360 [Gammaproteobacteria bacterium]